MNLHRRLMTGDENSAGDGITLQIHKMNLHRRLMTGDENSAGDETPGRFMR